MWIKEVTIPVGSPCHPEKTSLLEDWIGALYYVRCLNEKNYLGYNDWRLPNINDLMSMINYNQADQAVWLSSQGFTALEIYPWYWSSSNYAYAPKRAWALDMFAGGELTISKDFHANYVWPVRSGQSCTYNFSPKNYGFSFSSGTRSITVTTSSTSCSWTATSNDGWITIASGSSGTGSGTITYNVTANKTNKDRIGTITIISNTFTITQKKMAGLSWLMLLLEN
jgi:hypothetical protein